MKTYRKGFRAERELLRFLSSRGYSCVRSASSGGFLTPVDVVAIKSGKLLCFEIKSWARKPRLDRNQLSRFSEWCRNAQAHGFVAWYNQNQWRFLPLHDAEANRYGDEFWIDYESFLRVFTQ
jgi:Holliday junction resolvase